VNKLRTARLLEAGSIAPLGIGLGVVSLTTILVLSAVSSLFVFERRLTSMAEFAALSGLRYNLSAEDFIREGGVNVFQNLRVAADSLPDGLTREVTLCAMWKAPLPTFIRLSEVEICGTGAARAG
jgi:hypothetical protein